MREHWKAEDGTLVFDGKGDNLCTARDYRDFEMLVDWKLPPKGDSGIYLRGTPQVQIWDPTLRTVFVPRRIGGLVEQQEERPRSAGFRRPSHRPMEPVPHFDGRDRRCMSS